MIQWSEKDLEDWLCSPVEEGGNWRLFDVLGDILPRRQRELQARAVRQVLLGDMRADILIAWPDRLIVLELKAKPATGDDLAQVLHYKSWIEGRTMCKSVRIDLDAGTPVKNPDVVAYLIAPSFSDRIQAAAFAAGVRLVQIQAEWAFNEERDNDNSSIPLAWDSGEQPCDKYILFGFGQQERAQGEEI